MLCSISRFLKNKRAFVICWSSSPKSFSITVAVPINSSNVWLPPISLWQVYSSRTSSILSATTSSLCCSIQSVRGTISGDSMVCAACLCNSLRRYVHERWLGISTSTPAMFCPCLVSSAAAVRSKNFFIAPPPSVYRQCRK